MDRLKVATGIDLPADHPGGSMVLLRDLYSGCGSIDSRVFTLPPAQAGSVPAEFESLLVNAAKQHASGLGEWVDALADALTRALRPTAGDIDIVHCQHLAFGMSPALIRALPDVPRLGLVHGTDILFASRYPGQLLVLRQVVEAVDCIVVPTDAMADQVRRLAPGTASGKIVKVPWGVPDELIARPQPVRRAVDGTLRILYAGRLTEEKGVAGLIDACRGTGGVHLTIIGPSSGHQELRALLGESAPSVEFLDLLPRDELWAHFASYDVLALPSTTLEAFGLTGVEAQACGLPVLYRPVPGLTEVLGESGMPVDFADPAALTRAVEVLRGNASVLDELRHAGHANAANYPLSVTSRELSRLSREIADMHLGPNGAPT